MQLLIEDYDFFVRDTDTFCARLDALRVLRGNEVVNGWQEAARAGRTREVVRDLLVSHYDPVYLQSMKRNFAGFAQPLLALEWDGSAASLDAAARQVSLSALESRLRSAVHPGVAAHSVRAQPAITPDAWSRSSCAGPEVGNPRRLASRAWRMSNERPSCPVSTCRCMRQTSPVSRSRSAAN